MALNNTALNLMLDQLATVAVWVSLHTDIVGSGSGGEVTGGSPAYARKAITWFSASAGDLDNNANPTFDVPASTTIKRLGFWSASTAGTYYGDADITDEVYAGQGTYTTTDVDIILT